MGNLAATNSDNPRPPLIIDATLSKELEGAEAATSHAFCRAAAAAYPHLDILSIPCGGGFGLHYGPADPLNAVKGVGLNGPVDPSEWETLEATFRASGSPVVIDLSPFADESFIALLATKNYVTAAFETVTCRKLDRTAPTLPIPNTADIKIEIVNAARAKEWSRIIGVGFADGGDPFPFAVDFGLVRERLPNSLMFLATVSGTPAGGAGLSIHNHVAHMAGAAVLPQFRGKGIQQALTAARLQAATDRGCTLAKLDVRAGSASYRNAVRAGFEVAYTRPQLLKAW